MARTASPRPQLVLAMWSFTSASKLASSLMPFCSTLWPLWAYNAAECVRLAPSALNLQPWKLAFAGRTMMLQRKRFGSDLDLGIALLHMSLGVGEKDHVIRLGEGKEVASLVAEDRI